MEVMLYVHHTILYVHDINQNVVIVYVHVDVIHEVELHFCMKQHLEYNKSEV